MTDHNDQGAAQRRTVEELADLGQRALETGGLAAYQRAGGYVPGSEPRPVRHRLTDRDKAALDYVAALRAVRLDDVGVLLAALAGRGSQPLGPRTTRDVVARWRALGFVRLEPYPGEGPAIVLPLAKATNLSRLARPRPLSWTEAPHTLATAAVAAFYLARAGGSWTAETRLRMQVQPGQHLPDGLWRPPAAAGSAPPPVAVEVERSGKAGARWEVISYDLLARYGHVHYWLSAATGPAWLRWSTEHLPTVDRARITTYELETQGVAR